MSSVLLIAESFATRVPESSLSLNEWMNVIVYHQDIKEAKRCSHLLSQGRAVQQTASLKPFSDPCLSVEVQRSVNTIIS